MPRKVLLFTLYFILKKETTFFMKKITYIFALLALTACSNDDVVETSTDDVIQLAVTANNASRALELHGCNQNLDMKFTLWALKTKDGSDMTSDAERALGTDYHLNGLSVTGEADGTATFDDGQKHYWPGTSTLLNFFALHDKNYYYDNDNALKSNNNLPFFIYSKDSSGATTIELASKNRLASNGNTSYGKYYELPADADSQDDALYAVALGQTRKTHDKKVVLNFKHLLSLLEFKFSNALSTTYIEINGIQLNNIYRKANFTITESTDAQYTTSGTTAFENGITWQPLTGDQLLSESETAAYTDADGNADYQIMSVNATDNPNSTLRLMVIPQNGRDPDDQQELLLSYMPTVALSCRLYNILNPTDFADAVDAAKGDKSAIHALLTDNTYAAPIYTSDSDNYININLAIPFDLDATTQVPIGWQAGKKYVYTITFGGSDNLTTATDDDGHPLLVPMSITGTVDIWPTTGTNTSLDN
jgi:hypothetical protein